MWSLRQVVVKKSSLCLTRLEFLLQSNFYFLSASVPLQWKWVVLKNIFNLFFRPPRIQRLRKWKKKAKDFTAAVLWIPHWQNQFTKLSLLFGTQPLPILKISSASTFPSLNTTSFLWLQILHKTIQLCSVSSWTGKGRTVTSDFWGRYGMLHFHFV